MALKDVENVENKQIGFGKMFAIRGYSLVTGVTSLAIGSEALYGVMGKLMNTLPFALNLGVGITRGLAATAASAGVALVVGAGINYGVEKISEALENNKLKKLEKNTQFYNESQMGMNI